MLDMESRIRVTMRGKIKKKKNPMARKKNDERWRERMTNNKIAQY